MQSGVSQRKGAAGGGAENNNTANKGGDTPSTPDTVAVPIKEGASALALMVGHKNANDLQSRGGVVGVARSLSTDPASGITKQSVATRRGRYGANKLPEEQLLTFWDYVKETLEDKTMMILVGSAVVSLILGMTTPDPRTGEVDRSTGWIEGAAILASVVIVTIVSAVNNYKKQLQFRALSGAETVAPVVVVRDGNAVEVPNEDVVVGDLALVMAGMALSFDALLVDGTGFSANESSITGENDDVHKAPDGDAFLISGTHIVDGCDGLAVVVAVGPQSFAGSISMATRQEKKDTPLQEQLTDMADLIGKFGLAAAVFTFAVLFVKELYVYFFAHGKMYAMKFFENLTTAVAIVVVAVPEGLPLSVTLSLAYSMKQMLEDKNLVRHLAACETMGGATCICTDKTGTLTNNDMRPVTFFADNERFTVPTDGSAVAITGDSEPRRAVLNKLLDSVAYNFPSTFGNKTAIALQQLGRQLSASTGYDPASTVGRDERERIQRFAFSSLRKRSSVVVHQQQAPASVEPGASARRHAMVETSTLTHYVIGAAELVFQKCTSAVVDGRRTMMTIEAKARYEQVIADFSSSGFRTLCVAYSEKSGEQLALPHVPPEDPLTIVAVVAIEEPLRAEVPAAVAACRGAGIRVRMVTGDSVATARHIAQRSGITAGSDSLVIDGAEFRSHSDDDIIANILPRLDVLARATPLDKQRLVELIDRSSPDQVVAVTGDGTNDAPALKAASVGIAMNTGSDIAKQASDIVLLDDNFVGVVKAVVWGRNVRDNIRKFLQFQLTVNTVACIVAFLGAVVNTQNLSPLKPVQLLWLNLIMDTFAALALATEMPNDQQLLKRQPDPRNASIITRDMVHNIAIMSAFQLATQLLMLVYAHRYLGVPFFGDVHLTVTFNTFVLLQVFNFFNARLLNNEVGLLSNLGRSAGMLYIMFLIVVLQVVIVQRGGKFMSTVPLDAEQWWLCILISSAAIPVGVVSRALLPRPGSKSEGIAGVIQRVVSRFTAPSGPTPSAVKRSDKE